MEAPDNENASVIETLRDIEARSRDHSQALPQTLDSRENWEGIVFSVGQMRFVAPLGEVNEILNYPANITGVPGTHPWVKGVANIRGDLLTIIDLKSYLGLGVTSPGRRNRVLVIDHNGMTTGLLVGETVGMRHFSEQNRIQPDQHEVEVEYQEYVTSSFTLDDEVWPIFNFPRLFSDQRFLLAAN